ncbi:MAG TPA: penicillin-binding protein 1A [Limnochordia bacterium]|nr:penicillin-binding protein 1A [Limnochordia bacterium]
MGRQARPRPRRRAFIIIFAFTISIAIGAMAGVVAGYFRSVPPLDEVNFDPKLTTYIYDVKGRVIARLFTENRIPVRLHEIPEVVRLAFIAAEDSDFYQHHGIDFFGIARAALVNLRAGAIEQGGSTITQQLAKLAFLTNDRTWSRKFKELLLAIQIERKYTKDEILESYLNVVYFGHGAYGVEAASQIFFQKSVSEVNLQEAALLAAVVNGPGYYSPFYDMEAATRRRNLVLRRMLDLGFIDQAAYDEAVSSPIELKDGRRQQTIAPHFVIYVREQLLDRYGAQMVYTGGLRVYTTLDLDLQRAAEKAIEEMVPVQETDENGLAQPQAALVTIDVHTGEIRAMVGGRNNDQYNRAVQATRQPGSAMKPFVYAAAIDSKRYTPAHIMVDEPTTFTLVTGETWTPRNYDNTHRGPMSLRTALEDSINVVAAKLIDEIGPATAIDYAKRMGITTLQESGRLNDLTLSFALGGLTRGVTLLEMATAYGVFASGGIRTTPIAILRVEGPDGTVIDEFRPQRRLVLSPETAYIMTDMMRGVIERGTGVGANIGRPAAGKTGTTSSFTDAWFVGYTPSLVTAIWIGNDNNEPMIYPGRQIGSGTAARTWRAYMSEVVKGTPVEEFPRPPGIVGPLAIDVTNGRLVNDTCSGVPMNERVYEIFIEGTEPTEVSERCSTLFNLPNIFRRLFSSP